MKKKNVTPVKNCVLVWLDSISGAETRKQHPQRNLARSALFLIKFERGPSFLVSLLSAAVEKVSWDGHDGATKLEKTSDTAFSSTSFVLG